MSEQYIFDLIALARKRARTTVQDVAVVDMPRIRPMLNSDEAVINGSFEFDVDEEGVHFLSGRIRARLELRCQRCLGELDLEVDTRVRLGIVRSLEEANDLPERYEPVIVEDTRFSLLELIEDELLLALPSVPLHGYTECRTEEESNCRDEQQIQAYRPFSRLDVMLKRDSR